MTTNVSPRTVRVKVAQVTFRFTQDKVFCEIPGKINFLSYTDSKTRRIILITGRLRDFLTGKGDAGAGLTLTPFLIHFIKSLLLGTK